MSVSVDGFVSGPNREVDWIFRTGEGATEWLVDTLWQAGLHAMGSRTYYDMATFWPSSGAPLAAPMNEIPKAVWPHRYAGHPGEDDGVGQGLLGQPHCREW
jgi:hypothetical protein